MKHEKLMMTIRLWAIILCTVLGILLLTLIIFNEEVYKKVAVEAVEFTLVLIIPVLILVLVTMKDVNKLMSRVREREEIFRIVSQHSHRILYSYELATGTTQPWDEENAKHDVLAHLYAGSYSDERLEKNQSVMPDSIKEIKEFFAKIHRGYPSGEMKIHIRLADGEPKWFDFQYSNIFEGNKPVTAIISVEDITEQHEHELAYLRYVESVEMGAEGHLLYVESDLTDDRIEKIKGELLSELETSMGCTHAEFGKLFLQDKFFVEDFLESTHLFSCKSLLELYHRGEHQFKGEMKVHFHDESSHWLSVEIILIEDPFNHHIKALTRMMDITEQWEEHLSIVQRADYDTMTGLLRKDVGESQIRSELLAGNKSGILMILDLDDLKGINDQLGHDQGDKAIIGISDMIKSHFRKEDILIRAGGDEFIVFLKGAGQSAEVVEQVVADLIRELSEISIGEKKDRTIHCSIGCAVESAGKDTFETLFKRADRALYHVKRNGKNNFAFYVPEMEREDYEFRSRKLLFEKNERKLEVNEMKNLVDSIMHFHDMVMAINLSTNTYYIMDEVKGGVFADFPAYGELDSFLEMVSGMLPQEDREDFYAHLSREATLGAYHDGEKNIHYFLPVIYNGERRKVECTVILYSNEKGDICDITLLRWVSE